MPDIETVIKAWEIFRDSNPYEICSGREFRAIREPEYCMGQMIEDTIALLKEQEAVEPIYIENPYTHLPVSYCPKCREPINQYITGNPYKETKYCHYCGQAVKWE